MKRFLGACFAAALLLGSRNVVHAGFVLNNGYANAYQNEYTYNETTSTYANPKYSDSNTQYLGSPFPNSTTTSVSNSASSAIGNVSTASNSALTILPGLVIALNSSTSSGSIISRRDNINSYAGTASVNDVSFTLTSPYSYTLIVDFTPLISATAAPGGTSGAFDYSQGYYQLSKYSSGNVTYGFNEQHQFANSALVTYGYNYLNGSYVGGYTPSVMVSGVLQPGSYKLVSYSQVYGSVYGINNASFLSSANQSLTLELTPAVPEPSSVALLSVGAAVLGVFHLRRRKLAQG
jgi:hypothetical protein